MRDLIAAIFLVVAASYASAQTLAPELAPAEAKYKSDITALDAQRAAALAQARRSHAAALDAAEKTATASGNLAAVAGITKEREALTRDLMAPNFPDALPKTLQTTRKAYLDAAARIRASDASRRSAIAADYLRALASLQSKASASPELAKQIAAEKEKLLGLTVPAATNTPKATNQRLSNANIKLIQSYFEEKTWEFSGLICYFDKKGRGLYQQNGRVLDTVSWTLAEDGTLIINGFGRHKRVTFTSPQNADVIQVLPGGVEEKGLSAHLSDRTITRP